MSSHQSFSSVSSHRIRGRKVSFDLSRTPLRWLPQDPVGSHILSEIHMILPEGEFWFCRVYNQALPYIKDEALREDVKGFIRQEAMHARAHENDGMKGFLHTHGIETDSYHEKMKWLFQVLLSDSPLGVELPRPLAKQWLMFRLSVIAAIEHLTCVLGNFALQNPHWDASHGDANVIDMLRWHGAEEVEHRCIAYDVYAHLGGGYIRRNVLVSLVVPLIIYLWSDGAAHIMQQDPKFPGKAPRGFGLQMMRLWQKSATQHRNVPTVGRIIRDCLSYLKPSYNPQHEGSTDEALRFLDQLMARQMKQAA